MLRFLFPRLTADPDRGQPAFERATAIARQPGWYRDGKVSDTLDGRFAVLATVIALALTRLEHLGESGNAMSVALTERFIAVMEAEHRELGLGDPTLGKTVRRLVGSLARRNNLWRGAVAGATGWDEAVRTSLFKAAADPEAIAFSAARLRQLWSGLEDRTCDQIEQGDF